MQMASRYWHVFTLFYIVLLNTFRMSFWLGGWRKYWMLLRCKNSFIYVVFWCSEILQILRQKGPFGGSQIEGYSDVYWKFEGLSLFFSWRKWSVKGMHSLPHDIWLLSFKLLFFRKDIGFGRAVVYHLHTRIGVLVNQIIQGEMKIVFI